MPTKSVVLIRYGRTQKAVYGVLMVIEDGIPIFTCYTIERTSKLFPDGNYQLKLEYSPRFQTELWELYGVSGRAEIKIHVVNYADDLDGCIGVGSGYSDINKDGTLDLINSKKTAGLFKSIMSNKVKESTISVLTFIPNVGN